MTRPAPLPGVNCRQRFNRKEAKKIIIPEAAVLSLVCKATGNGVGSVSRE